MGQAFDLVITLCDQAAEECPLFPGAAQQLHWGFADPSRAMGTEPERLSAFRHTRDLILVRLRQWLAEQGEQLSSEGAAIPVVPDGLPADSPAKTSRLPISPSGMATPTRVLILCTGNSARSQMAEAWLRYLGGTAYAVSSAGTHPTMVNPLAIQVMGERHIDISQARSKSVSEFLDQPFDYVITVCDRAAEQCPIFPGKAERLHWSFPDPAAETGSPPERLQAFRNVRDGLYFQFWLWITDQLSIEQGEAQPQRLGEHG
jgi:arsenate reductase